MQTLLYDGLTLVPESQGIHNDLDGVRDEYLRLRERVVKQLEGTAADSEQAKFLRKELDLLNQKLGDLQGLSSAYLQRYGSHRSSYLLVFFLC